MPGAIARARRVEGSDPLSGRQTTGHKHDTHCHPQLLSVHDIPSQVTFELIWLIQLVANKLIPPEWVTEGSASGVPGSACGCMTFGQNYQTGEMGFEITGTRNRDTQWRFELERVSSGY